MIGSLPEVPCVFCHEGSGALASLVPEPSKKASNYRETRDTLLATAARAGLKGEARFDWLVDIAQKLPTHKDRPEFTRLFEKFRIGKTHYTFTGHNGKRTSIRVRNCEDCHLAGDDAGATNARYLYAATHGLTSMIARAERIQLAAHRGGVETRQARLHLDNAVDNQIELESLIHTFGGPDVPLKEKEGLENARAALVNAQSSLEELGYRRRGLFVALGVIVLVLIALAMKIRTL
jgi:hypothetical protein